MALTLQLRIDRLDGFVQRRLDGEITAAQWGKIVKAIRIDSDPNVTAGIKAQADLYASGKVVWPHGKDGWP